MEAFESIDVNRDGVIDRAEWEDAVAGGHVTGDWPGPQTSTGPQDYVQQHLQRSSLQSSNNENNPSASSKNSRVGSGDNPRMGGNNPSSDKMIQDVTIASDLVGDVMPASECWGLIDDAMAQVSNPNLTHT